MNLEGFEFKRIKHDDELLQFDCDDKDLNEFFLKDSKEFLKNFLAVTYVLEKNNQTILFFSILNDRISIDDVKEEQKTSIWNRLNRKIPNNKRSRSYPCVKVGRFATHKDYAGQGIGREVLNYIKYWFIDNNKTGCRFITVDAYKTAVVFYEKADFKYLCSEESEKDSDTRLMYFDLKRLTV
jgi:GNAT superfamily N-acetyltransferase